MISSFNLLSTQRKLLVTLGIYLTDVVILTYLSLNVLEHVFEMPPVALTAVLLDLADTEKRIQKANEVVTHLKIVA